MPITCICQTCTQPFSVEPSRKDALFCSNACKGIARRSSVTLSCQQCHSPFTVKAYRRETARFCSKACLHASMTLPEEKDVCAYCDQEFVVTIGQRQNKTGIRLCSPTCRGLYTGINKRTKALKTFWQRVNICEHGWDCPYCCWPFVGTLDLHGYGRIIVNKKQTYTHRTAWELHNAQRLPAHLKAAHYCHFTSCCNFDHIHATTQHGNLHDSIRDRRHSFGERNGHSKMSEETAIAILEKRAEGWNLIQLVTHFGTPYPATEALCAGRSWKYLQRPEGVPPLEKARKPHQLFLIR